MILRTRDFVGINLDAGAADLLDIKENLEIDAVGVVYVTRGVTHGDNLATHGHALFSAVLGDVAGAGNYNFLAFEAVVSDVLKNLGGEVADAIAGSLGTGGEPP